MLSSGRRLISILSGSAFWGFLCIVLLASGIQASLGFGFSIFAMMFFPYLFATYPQAAAISSLLSISTSCIVAVRMRKQIRWRALLPCAVGYLFSAPAAIHYSTILEKVLLTRILGGALVALGLYFIFLGGRIRIRPCARNGVITGLLSGVGGGFFAVGGPPLVVYFLSSLQNKEEYSATIQCCMVVTGLYAAAVRAANGIFTIELLKNCAAGAAAMVIGAGIGYAVMEKLPAERLKRLIYCVMIFSGAKMLLGL